MNAVKWWIATAAVIVIGLFGLARFFAKRDDYFAAVRSRVIKESHEYVFIQSPNGMETVPAERVATFFNESDQALVVDCMRKETARRRWWAGIHRPSTTVLHAVFVSQPLAHQTLYTLRPMLSAVNWKQQQLVVNDQRPLTIYQYWMVRAKHPFHNPFLAFGH